MLSQTQLFAALGAIALRMRLLLGAAFTIAALTAATMAVMA